MTAELPPKADDSSRRRWREVVTALGLSGGAAVALGLSRFSYGLLLPPMRTDLGWSYVEAGAMNTANGAGYVVGALVAAWIAYRWGMARTFLLGFAVSVVILLVTAATTNVFLLMALRTIGGASTALTFILGAGLASAICPAQDPRRRGTLVGLYVAGVGVGILVSGVAIPIVLDGGARQWPAGWIVLGVIGAVCLPGAWWAARNVREPAGGRVALLKGREFRQILPTFIGYGLFGAGYVGYMTFIIALLQAQGRSSGQVIWFWSVLGLVSAVATLLWGKVLGALREARGPSMVFATVMLGTLPVLLFPSSPAAMFVSAILFGGSFLAGPTAITIVAQRQLPVSSWTAAIALLTVSFAFGQAVSPMLAGAISDATGNISAGFWVSPVMLAAAAGVNLLQRPAAEQLIQSYDEHSGQPS